MDTEEMEEFKNAVNIGKRVLNANDVNDKLFFRFQE